MALREEIRSHLVSIGCDVWWAEELVWPSGLTPDEILSTCLAGIDTCDIYLGVFPARYGSDPLELAYTELEYHYAGRRGIPRLLYQIRDQKFISVDQRLRQNAFLLMVKDSDLNALPAQKATSRASLLRLIEEDIRGIGSEIDLGNGRIVHAPNILRLVSTARLAQTIVSAREIDLHSAPETLRAVYHRSLLEAVTLGLALLQRHLRYPDWKNSDYIRGIDGLLDAWSYVASWRRIQGPLGQIQIAKARITLSEMSGHLSLARMSELAIGVSSSLYASRRLTEARRWYDLSKRNGRSTPWLEGPIELARGNLPRAKEIMCDVLRQREDSPDTIPLYLGYFGHCQVLEGNIRLGLKHLDAARSHLQVSTQSRVRILRLFANSHLHLGDYSAAEQLAKEGVELAKMNGLLDQLNKFARIRRSILSNRKVRK